MDSGNRDITQLLKAADNGDRQAANDLLPLVYSELRRLASSWLAQQPPGQTLQPTALVHEAFLRLVGREESGWENRGHFFFAAGRAMRDILIERARGKGRVKHGGELRRRVDFDFDSLCGANDAPSTELLALDEVLKRFEVDHPEEYRIVILRFFAGLSNEETARALNTPLRTIEREWRFARAWLRAALEGNSKGAGGQAP